MTKEYLMTIASEVTSVLKKVDSIQLDNIVLKIKKNKRIFVDGEGRSGFIGKCFAMRLMHLGFEVYVMGETNTPSFEEQDIYVSISGSGATPCVLINARKASEKGVYLITLVGKTISPLSELSNSALVVPAKTRQDTEDDESIQLLGSLFDQSVHLILDSICLSLSHKEKISNSEAIKRHV